MANNERMENSLNTQEARECRERSEFLKQLTDFARFTYGEHIEPADGERAMFICAADRTVGNGTQGSATMVMGGKQTMLAALVTLLQSKDEDGQEFASLLRTAVRVSASVDDAAQSLTSARRQLRSGYGMAALCGLWAVCIVVFQTVGIANWITTVSNLLLMAYVGFMLYRSLREQRQRVRRLKREKKQAAEQEAMRRFGQMLENIARQSRADDDDDDE